MSHRGRIVQDTWSMSISNDYLEATSLPSCGPSRTSALPPFSTLIMRREPPRLLSPCHKTFKCSFLRKKLYQSILRGKYFVQYASAHTPPSCDCDCGWQPAGQIHGSYQFQLAFVSQPTRSHRQAKQFYRNTSSLHCEAAFNVHSSLTNIWKVTTPGC